MDRLGAIWLLPASMLTAMAVSFVAPSFQAFVAEELTEETRGRVYGITSAMFMVVNIIGPLLGGLIAQGLSFKTMYLVAGCMYAIAGLDSSTSCQAVFQICWLNADRFP